MYDRDGYIGKESVCPFLPPLAVRIAGELGNLPGYRVEFEAAQKLLRLGLLAWAHAHVNLSDVHRATSEKDIPLGKLCEKLGRPFRSFNTSIRTPGSAKYANATTGDLTNWSGAGIPNDLFARFDP
jgi:hypothetical protein